MGLCLFSRVGKLIYSILMWFFRIPGNSLQAAYVWDHIQGNAKRSGYLATTSLSNCRQESRSLSGATSPDRSSQARFRPS